MTWLPLIPDIIKFILSSVKKSNFYGWVIIIMLFGISVIGYFVFKLYEEKGERPSEFDREVVDSDVQTEMITALNNCGDGSFLFWTVLEDGENQVGKYLKFKEALSCNKDRARIIMKIKIIVSLILDSIMPFT